VNAELQAVATVLSVFDGATITESDHMGAYAVELAHRGWAVIPLRGKAPAIPGGRGVLDASTDLHQVAAWWSGRYAGANIGARVPEPLIVVDVDPRHDGHESLAALEAEHGSLPETLTVRSGRGDGGSHRYYRRPAGKLTSSRLRGSGIDLKTSAGYVVMPPSLHPDSGEPYTWTDRREPVPPPRWLVDLLRPAAPPQRPAAARWRPSSPGGSVADDYTSRTSWADVLAPHGWVCLDGDPDADGARWRHPAATAAVSATVRHGCLFCYTTSTALPVTEAGDPHGLTRFRAHAILDHGGDLSAAARSLRERRAVA